MDVALEVYIYVVLRGQMNLYAAFVIFQARYILLKNLRIIRSYFFVLSISN